MKIIKSKSVAAMPVTQDAKGVTIRKLIAEDEGAPNFHMRMFEVQPGGNTPFHTHDWEHEVFILKGSGAVVTEAGDMEFQAGDAIFVPANEKHQFKNTGSEAMRFLCLIPITGICT